MPNYDFRCTRCKKTFTLNLTWADFDKTKGKPKCPKCRKKSDVEQVFGAQTVKTSKKS